MPTGCNQVSLLFLLSSSIYLFSCFLLMVYIFSWPNFLQWDSGVPAVPTASTHQIGASPGARLGVLGCITLNVTIGWITMSDVCSPPFYNTEKMWLISSGNTILRVSAGMASRCFLGEFFSSFLLLTSTAVLNEITLFIRRGKKCTRDRYNWWQWKNQWWCVFFSGEWYESLIFGIGCIYTTCIIYN